MRIVTDDGVGLEVVDRGAGPALVLVHGFGGAKEDFSDHVEALARDHRVITLDLRGHGESDGPTDEASYSLDRFAADVANVADALDLPTVRLLGHSMGGMIVRRFVLASPDRVEALVLMDTSPGPVPGMDAELIDLGVQIAREQGMDELKRVMDAFSPLGTAAYERTLVERPGYREFNDRKWETLSPAMYTKMLVEIRDQPDELDALRAVTCPTLVIVGVQDSPFAAVSEAMAEAIADARCEVIPDAGHSPQFENPPAWLASLQGFLTEVEARAPAA